MGYEYDHDCPFEAFITNLGKYNEGELVGEWVKFPTTSEELQKVFERIGIGSKDEFGNPYEEWFISDYDCYVSGLYDKLGEYESLDELNYLASKLQELDNHEYEHFQAAMQISDYTGNVKDVINLIDNLDKYDVYPGVEDEADLGRYYVYELGMMQVPEHLQDYIDYEAIGRDVSINESGQFTTYGYVRDTQESFTEYYDGDRENIPDEYRVMNFQGSNEKERKTMDYETFKQEFAEDIKQNFYERGYGEVTVNFNEVEKANQKYEAMSVVAEGSNVGVNFNLEQAFAAYENSGDYQGVVASAANVIAEGLDNAPAVDVSALVNYDAMKDNVGEAWRIASGLNASEKVQSIVLDGTFATAFSNPMPSFHPMDLLVGIACGAALRLAVYLKGKNAKKFRHNEEYGSARWGKHADIEPFEDPEFKNNIILSQTERMTMNGRPKLPKNARNKNVLVVGGSGSGKTRFFIKPNMLQLHSSYVLTDPKG